ncbi:YsnF/AvaK domain-containing protein [Altericroceibacterium xinjiangense]|uniref:YsnF/AvaK domain-containing protein n=1 Tax=Altericroceibacterium xinjiangense TaxID=762261 RepID=UPI000F7E1310|nr:YsnF/AvaK domain-containing protein [Altericroceibacterium xinjiangense]
MKDKKPGASASEVIEEARIPLVEERVVFDKKVVEGRTVRVRTRPVTETVTVSEPVTREEVTVERVPVGRVVTEAPDPREEGDVTIISVVEERARVVTEMVLVEEIHLRRARTTEAKELEVEVQRTEVEIDEGTPKV